MTATLPVIKWKLRSVMADRRMTATKLADLLEVNRVTVSGWVGSDEIPAFRNPTETLNQLCKYLDCVPSDLIAYTPDEEGASDRPSTPPPAPEPPGKASRRSTARRAAKEASDRALRDDSTQGWQSGDTFTHGGIDWRVKSVGNRYLKLVNWDSGEEEGGFWDTQLQQLQRQGKSA